MAQDVKSYINDIVDDLKNSSGEIELNECCHSYDAEELVDALAGDMGCINYGDACVYDVKGRPHLSFDIEDLGINEDLFNDIYWEEINDFVESIEADYPDFIVEGKSGGYWGFDNAFNNVVFSPRGIEEIKAKLLEKYNQLISEEGSEVDEDIQETTQYVADTFLNDIFEDMLLFTENFEFNSDYVLKLTDLKKRIDEKEQEMDNIDYWKALLPNHFEDEEPESDVDEENNIQYNLDKEKAEEIFIGIAEQYDDPSEIREELQGLRDKGDLTQDEYKYIVDNWDELLERHNL